jgi:ribosome-binding protein aMBF1 (putative translation factor)
MQDKKYIVYIIVGVVFMAKTMFLIKGNICAERVRLGRALQSPHMTQEELAQKIQLMGMEMTPVIISRIEKNQRHICDAELRAIAKALGVSMEWLCGDIDEIKLNK